MENCQSTPNSMKKEFDVIVNLAEDVFKKYCLSDNSIEESIHNTKIALKNAKLELDDAKKLANDLQNSLDCLFENINDKITKYENLLSKENIERVIASGSMLPTDKIYRNFDYGEIVKKHKEELKSTLDALHYTHEIYNALFDPNSLN